MNGIYIYVIIAMHDKRKLEMLEREEEMMYDPRFRPLVPREDRQVRPGIHFNIVTPHAAQFIHPIPGAVATMPPQGAIQSQAGLDLPGISESHDYIREPIGTPPPPYESVVGLGDPLGVGYGASMQTVLVQGQSDYPSQSSAMV